MSNIKGKGQFQARLENQKSQLERHGNFAEVVIRTTPEATDMINFARLWEHIMVVGDRQTRGYIAKSTREDFDKTRDDFNKSVGDMLEKMKACIARHEIDLSGNNFISRVAQRYELAERKKKEAEEAPAKKAKPAEEKAPAPAAENAQEPASEKPKSTEEQVDGF